MENIFKQSLLTLSRSETNALSKFLRQYYLDLKDKEYLGFLKIVDCPDLLDNHKVSFELLNGKSRKFEIQKLRKYTF